MASPDERQISLEEVKAAVSARDLPALVSRLVRERSWSALTVLFRYAAAEGKMEVGLAELESAGRSLAEALRAIRPPRNPGAALTSELRAVRRAAAETLFARSNHPPLTDMERRALRQGAALLGDAGDHVRAAATYEELGDHGRAAEAFGAMGDLERMEAALGREETRDRAQRAAQDAMRQFDVLMSGGERRRAIAVAAEIAPSGDEGAAARQLAARVEDRLARGRAVTLRVVGAAPVRVAGLPALIGRDAAAEVPLRDPGASRRHAIIRREGGTLVLEDAGSRTGVRVGGARIGAPFPLRGEGEIAIGATTVLGFRVEPEGHVFLRGVAGLDRQLEAVIGADPVPLGSVIPAAAGLWLELGSGVARLGRPPERMVRVAGNFVGGGCDLLHGDVLEVSDASGAFTLRLEVE